MSEDTKNNFLYVVIPAYNEEENIGWVIKKLKKITKKILVVDDGSVDKTNKILDRLKVIVVRHRINLGKGAAMKTGAQLAFSLGAQQIIFMDADRQHDPGEFFKLSQKLKEGYEVVFGSRSLVCKTPLIRWWGNRLGSFLLKKTFGINLSDPFCGYLAMTKKAYEKIIWNSSHYEVETEIVVRVAKNKLKYAEVPIQTIYLDKYKGMTIFDALGIILTIPKLKFQ